MYLIEIQGNKGVNVVARREFACQRNSHWAHTIFKTPAKNYVQPPKASRLWLVRFRRGGGVRNGWRAWLTRQSTAQPLLLGVGEQESFTPRRQNSRVPYLRYNVRTTSGNGFGLLPSIPSICILSGTGKVKGALAGWSHLLPNSPFDRVLKSRAVSLQYRRNANRDRPTKYCHIAGNLQLLESPLFQH
jgi:hypothetical protein